MADKSRPLVYADLSGGRDGFTPPWALKPNQCADAVNIDFYGTRFARKRGGIGAVATTFSAGGPFTGIISSLFRHVPGTDQAAAELWAVDDAATNVVGRMAAASTFAAPSFKDAPTGNGYDWTATTINGLLGLAYKSGQARYHVWDGSTVRRAGLIASGAPTAANQGTSSSIAFDASSSVAFTGTTWAHTCAAGATDLFVGVRVVTGATSAVTYAGVAMTLVASLTATSTFQIWYLANPTVGANNVVITNGGGTQSGTAVSYTGGAGVIDASNTTTSGAATTSITLTSVTDRTWMVFGVEDTSGNNSSANSNCTLRVTTGSNTLLDSNGPITPAGANTMVANNGGAAFSPVGIVVAFRPGANTPTGLRYYRQRSTVQVGGVTVRRSEPSASVSFTPSGSNANVRVTQATVINEGETHWEVEASTDNVTFYRIATVAIATTTYDDSAATSTYATNPLSAATGTYTLQKPYKFVGGDQNRHLGLSSWTSTDKQSRLEFSAVVGSLDIGDAERVDTTTNYFIDFDENDSGVPTGIAGPVLGAFYVFKDRRSYMLTPTGVTSAPFRVDNLSKKIGALHHYAIASAEDDSGNGALYFMSHRGPYRWGVNGLEYIGRGVEDFVRGATAVANGTTINLAASKSVARAVYYEDLRQVWFWWATGSSNDCNQCFKYDIVTDGWTRVPTSDLAANVRCAAMFSNTTGATMSLDLKPYIGETAAANKLSKAETGTDDRGTPFKAFIVTADAEVGGPGVAGNLGDAWLLAQAASGVTITDVITTDFDPVNISDAGTALLTAGSTGGTESASATRVLRRMDLSFRGGSFFRHQIGDAAAVSNGWTLERLVVNIGRDQQRAP